MNLRQGTRRAEQILQGILDSFSNPVWIVDTDGNLILNNHHAQDILDNECLRDTQSGKNSLAIKGKKFRVLKREINHGTDCFLYELKQEDETSKRMRESINMLSAALEKH